MKYLSIIKYLLLVVSFVLVALGITGTMEVDTMLLWTGIVLALTVLLVLFMPLIGVAQNPKSAVGSLIGLGGLAVVCLIGWFLASGDPIRLANGELVDDAGKLKFTDMALIATYIMFIAVILSLAFGELYKAFKKD